MSEKVIEIEGLHFSYPKKRDVLNNINFFVEKGEKIALMGDSGKGKSTLLRLIASYEKVPPSEEGKENSIKICYEAVEDDLPMDTVSYLPQDANKALFPWKTVKDNLYYPLSLRYKGLTKKILGKVDVLLSGNISEDEKRDITEILIAQFGNKVEEMIKAVRFCHECVKEFDIEKELSNYPLKLSGGQKKRLSVIMALSVKPEIVLLDEPFAGLDFKTTENLWKFLRKYFIENNTTVLLVTHSVDEAAVMADRVVFLDKKGEITPLATDDFKKYAAALTSENDKKLLENPGELLLHPSFNEYKKRIKEEYEKECVKSNR
jgi:ABC-type nitrate/sulfonate/bicarbonate transport system ATPase subunit